MEGNISSFESMGLVDGPGIRFVVFMQGCHLRCKYCHNPETWSTEKSNLYTPEALVEMIKRYKPYFGSDGGVTFSGGEPLLQPEFLCECLKLCKKENINTCLDTAGVGFGDYDEILDKCDLVIMDIKALDGEEYKELTGQSIDASLEFIAACQKHNVKMWLRQVIVPGLNDTVENVVKLKEYAKTLKNVERVELLGYKTFGVHKYKELNIPYRLEDVKEMDEDELKKLQKILDN